MLLQLTETGQHIKEALGQTADSAKEGMHEGSDKASEAAQTASHRAQEAYDQVRGLEWRGGWVNHLVGLRLRGEGWGEGREALVSHPTCLSLYVPASRSLMGLPPSIAGV